MQYDDLTTDHSRVVRTRKLTAELLQALFGRRVCAIHVPQYFSKSLAKRADQWFQKNAKAVKWRVGPGKGELTDMSYGIGIPRERARSDRAAEFYARNALEWTRKTRRAFAPELSPLDKLRLELAEIWPEGVDLRHFRGKPGNAGIVRIMSPTSLFDAKPDSMGVCHIDTDRHQANLSANMYVSMPAKGGELRIWNVGLHGNIDENPVYRMIRQAAFRPGVRNQIHYFLPKPLIIRPKVGDLVILDVARPHAVAGFSSGHRTSVQTFLQLRMDESGPRILVSS